MLRQISNYCYNNNRLWSVYKRFDIPQRLKKNFIELLTLVITLIVICMTISIFHDVEKSKCITHKNVLKAVEILG